MHAWMFEKAIGDEEYEEKGKYGIRVLQGAGKWCRRKARNTHLKEHSQTGIWKYHSSAKTARLLNTCRVPASITLFQA